MTSTATKTRETRLRRMAQRQGLALHKSRRRDPLATDYGRYWVVDPDVTSGRPIYGFPSEGTDDLDEVEEYLTTPPEERGVPD